MDWFFKKDNEKIFNLKDLDRKTLMYRVMPHFLGEVMTKYFRMTVEGTENIPRRGAGIIAPNHSGYSGFDAFLLGHHVHKATRRTARILTHHLWFLSKTTAIPMQKMGFIEATKANGIEVLKKKHLLVLFPEGEFGNFKPSIQRYHLQEFKRGFIRMALQTQCPIVPTLILGAEETHINLAQLKFTKYLRGMVLPIPLNVIPLPARWHIIFMEPIYLPYKPSQANNRELVKELCDEIREKMQQRISQEVAKRKHLYL
ncbi:MAG: acyltransferase family protein [Bdellovibrionales bacterium]|nr:acyltransferase family protein [Bdellovibrionales bacterium]